MSIYSTIFSLARVTDPKVEIDVSIAMFEADDESGRIDVYLGGSDDKTVEVYDCRRGASAAPPARSGN